jgi:hypothetical protein
MRIHDEVIGDARNDRIDRAREQRGREDREHRQAEHTRDRRLARAAGLSGRPRVHGGLLLQERFPAA